MLVYVIFPTEPRDSIPHKVQGSRNMKEKRESHSNIWGENIPGKGDSMYKIPPRNMLEYSGVSNEVDVDKIKLSKQGKEWGGGARQHGD